MTQNKRKTPQPVPRKKVEDDLEKTVMDFDLSAFEEVDKKENEDIVQETKQETPSVSPSLSSSKKAPPVPKRRNKNYENNDEKTALDINLTELEEQHNKTTNHLSSSDKKKAPKKLSEDDFDKTALDIDISMLENNKEITGKVRVPIDETAIVNVTPSEDSGFFDDDFFNEEITGTHQIPVEMETPGYPSSSQQDETRYLEVDSTELKESAEPLSQIKKTEKEPILEGASQNFSSTNAIKSSSLSIGQRLFSLYSFFSGAVFFLILIALGGSFFNGLAIILSSSFAFIGGLGLLGAVVVGWLKPRLVFLSMMILWLSLVTFMGFYGANSQIYYFYELPLSSVMAFFFFLTASVVMASLVLMKKSSFLLKIPGGVGWLFISLAFLISLFSSASYDGGFWSPAFFEGVPLYLRPSFFALVIGFPLLGVSVVLSMIFKKTDQKEMGRGSLALLLVLCLISYGLGINLLARNSHQTTPSQVSNADLSQLTQ